VTVPVCVLVGVLVDLCAVTVLHADLISGYRTPVMSLKLNTGR
jgi:hypothetical protein